MSKLMAKAPRVAYGKNMRGKIHSIDSLILTKCEVSMHEAFKKLLSFYLLPMIHSNIDVLFAPTSFKRNRTRMLKLVSILEKMDPDDINVFASDNIGKYENEPDGLDSLCLANFASSYLSQKAIDVPDEMKSYSLPVANIDNVILILIKMF